MDQYILEERYEDIVILRLNRPEKRNALSPELSGELHRTLKNIKQDKQIKAVILTGQGTAFCAGADLAYLQKLSAFTDEENLKDSQILADLFAELYELPKLTVAALNGPALAGGFGMALCCDYIFAADERVNVGFTEVRIGFVPAIVMNFLIRRIPLYKALHLAQSGAIITAEEARESGLVHEIYPSGKLLEVTKAYVLQLLEQNSFSAMMQTKKLFQELLEIPLNQGLDLSCRVNAKSRKSEDCQKGLSHFLNKKPIKWRS